MHTVAGMPSVRAAYAVAAAALPAENVVTPAGGRSLAARASIAFIIPRTLNAPVCCRFSPSAALGRRTRRTGAHWAAAGYARSGRRAARQQRRAHLHLRGPRAG